MIDSSQIYSIETPDKSQPKLSAQYCGGRTSVGHPLLNSSHAQSSPFADLFCCIGSGRKSDSTDIKTSVNTPGSTSNDWEIADNIDLRLRKD